MTLDQMLAFAILTGMMTLFVPAITALTMGHMFVTAPSATRRWRILGSHVQ